MAYLAIQPFKARLDKGVDYITNEEKTKLKEDALNILFEYDTNIDKTIYENGQLIDGINCDVKNAAKEFIYVQKSYGKENDVITAHHGWQSFHKDETGDPILVHKIGVEFAEQFFGDKFQVVVSTHMDRDHLHNHFFINAVSYKDGSKYHGNKTSLREARILSDKICLKHGLNIIENKSYKYQNKGNSKALLHGNSSWRESIKEDIRKSVRGCKNIDDFYSNMKKKGYLLKFGKHFAVSPPGYFKNDRRAFIRLRSLNDYRYTISYIEDSIREERLYEYDKPIRRYKMPVRKRHLSIIEKKYYYFLYSIGLIKKSQYSSAKKTRYYNNLVMKMNREIKYIKENNITKGSDIEERINILETRTSNLKKQRQKEYKKSYHERGDTLDEINKELKEIRGELKILRGIKVIDSKPNFNIGVKPNLVTKSPEVKSYKENGKEKK